MLHDLLFHTMFSRPSRFSLGIITALCVQRIYSCNFNSGRHHCSKGLEVRISNKPIESPFQIAECVLERFGPILLLIEALCNRVVFHFVILNPARFICMIMSGKQQSTKQISKQTFPTSTLIRGISFSHLHVQTKIQ